VWAFVAIGVGDSNAEVARLWMVAAHYDSDAATAGISHGRKVPEGTGFPKRRKAPFILWVALVAIYVEGWLPFAFLTLVDDGAVFFNVELSVSSRFVRW